VVGTGRSPDIKPYRGEKDYHSGQILFIAKHRFEEKGGYLLLDAFRIAQEKHSKLQLVILGNEKVKRLAANAKNVQVLGHIPFQQLQNLFNDSALLAMPALMEPWGLVYLEALACRTPILGLNRMAFPEISGGGKYGFIVNEPTPEAVAAGILDAMSDPGRLERMGHEGQSYCLKKFTWENTANAIASRIFAPASAAIPAAIH
jgi:glycosyltransferase involved in cell wall biosynthesis